MNTLFIIALLCLLTTRIGMGFIIQPFFFKERYSLVNSETRLYDKNHFGTEYDVEMSEYEKNILEESTNQLINKTCHFSNKNDYIKEIYANMRKYNILNRLLHNLKNEQTIIENNLRELGIDPSEENYDFEYK